MKSDMREVQLPSDLCESVEQRYRERFGALEQFLTFVLQELIRDDAAQMDRAEQQVIEERLKDLGYI
jgi:hypothetical protein